MFLNISSHTFKSIFVAWMYCISVNTASISKGQGLAWSPSTYLHTAWVVKDCLQLDFFMSEPVTSRQEELKLAEWDMTGLRRDFVCLIHRLDLVLFFSLNIPPVALIMSFPRGLTLFPDGSFHTNRAHRELKIKVPNLQSTPVEHTGSLRSLAHL